jgi:hypothetical protein
MTAWVEGRHQRANLELSSASLVLFNSSNGSFADGKCIADYKNARLIADFQTASFLCPKWKIVSRVDYGYLLMEMNVLKAEDLLKSESAGVVKLTEQCQDDLYSVEKDSFKSAQDDGLEKFCLRTSIWLTVPNVRDALERHGFFPSSQP